MKRGEIVALTLLLGCATPLPTATPTGDLIDSPPPTTEATQTAAPEPIATVGLARYDSDGLAFDYPADWQVITQNQPTGPEWVYVAVGTGAWEDGCDRSGTAVHCDGRRLSAAPGEVVAEFAYKYSGPAYSVFSVPDFDSSLLKDGLALSAEQSDAATRAEIYVPGHRNLGVRVVWGSPPIDSDREAVREMLATVSYSTDSRPLRLRSWDGRSDGRPCLQQTVQGQIARGDLGGLNLAMPQSQFGYADVSWPRGWTARIAEDRRAELLDDAGELVAREWDEVSIAGRGDPNDFRACPDGVTVVRRFPS